MNYLESFFSEYKNIDFLSGISGGIFVMGFSQLGIKRVSHKGEMSHTKQKPSARAGSADIFSVWLHNRPHPRLFSGHFMRKYPIHFFTHPLTCVDEITPVSIRLIAGVKTTFNSFKRTVLLPVGNTEFSFLIVIW